MSRSSAKSPAKKPGSRTAAPQAPASAEPEFVAPSDEVVQLELPGFEGPLDLLLHLIQEHELDILDIPIAFVTTKYLEHIQLMADLNIDVASEYLVMAATLAHIKSRTLLPSAPADVEDGEEEELDPRAELVRRLLEYQKYKKAAEELAQRSVLGRDVFLRPPTAQAATTTAPLAPVGSFKLLEAFQRVLARAKIVVDHEIQFERLSINDRINELVDVLTQRRRLSFDDLFEGQRTRAELIVTFLAILELTRLRMIHVTQETSLAPIFIDLAVSDEELAEGTSAAELGIDVPQPPAGDSPSESTEAAAPPVAFEPTGDDTALDEQELAEDEQELAEDEQEPAEDEQEPAEDEQEPAEDEQEPAEDEQEPAEDEQEPAEDEQELAEDGQKSALDGQESGEAEESRAVSDELAGEPKQSEQEPGWPGRACEGEEPMEARGFGELLPATDQEVTWPGQAPEAEEVAEEPPYEPVVADGTDELLPAADQEATWPGCPPGADGASEEPSVTGPVEELLPAVDQDLTWPGRAPGVEDDAAPDTSREPEAETLVAPDTSREPEAETLVAPDTSREPEAETLVAPDTSRDEPPNTVATDAADHTGPASGNGDEAPTHPAEADVHGGKAQGGDQPSVTHAVATPDAHPSEEAPGLVPADEPESVE